MSRVIDRNMLDEAFTGYMVSIRHPNIDFATGFPVVTLCGLALELADMLRGIYPKALVSVTRHDVPGELRTEADAVTERLKRRVIAARDAVNPGRALLEGIGYRFDKE